MTFVTTRKLPAALVETGVTPDAAAEEVERRVGAEIALLRAAAEAEGRAVGEAAGHEAARAETASRAAPAIGALRAVLEQLDAPLRTREQEVAALVTDLAFELARHIVGVEVKADAASLRQLVERLLQEAAAERTPRQRIVVRLNPADHAVLEPLVQLEHGALRADPGLSRGGAMVELIAPEGDPLDRIEWDASLEARLAAMRAALGLREEDGA